MLKSFELSHNGLSQILKLTESELKRIRAVNIFEHVNLICKIVGPVTKVSEKTILRTYQRRNCRVILVRYMFKKSGQRPKAMVLT